MKLKILLHVVIELSHLQTWVYMPPIWKGDKNTPSAFYCWGVKTIRFSVCFAFKAMSLWNTVSMTATFRVLLKCSIIMIHYVCLLSPTFMVRIPSHTFFPVMDQKPDRSFQNSLQWQPSRKVHHECNQNHDFLCSTSAPWRNWGRTSWTMVSTSGFTRYYKVTGLFFWAQTILTHFILCHNKIQLWGLLLWHFLCLYAEDAKCKWSERNFHIAIKRSKNIISSESHNWGNLSGTHRIILNQIWSSYYYWQICETLWLHVIQKGSDHIRWHQIW